MLNVRVDMGKLHSGMQTQQWKNGIVKNVMQKCAPQRCNNIPLWSLCFFIYFERVDTVIFSVKSFCQKCTKIDI